MTKRIFELAKEMNVSSKELVEAAKKAGMDVKSHMSTIDDAQESTLRKSGKASATKPAAPKDSKPATPKNHTNGNKAEKTATKPAANNRPTNAGDVEETTVRIVRNDKRSDKNRTQNSNSRQNQNNRNGQNTGGNKNWNGKKGKKNNRNNHRRDENRPAPTVRKNQPLPEVLVYSIGMNVQDIAKLIHRDASEIIKKLFMQGVIVNQNQSLDTETIELLALDYGIEAEQKEEVDIADINRFFE